MRISRSGGEAKDVEWAACMDAFWISILHNGFDSVVFALEGEDVCTNPGNDRYPYWLTVIS
jgi:hypothetical protein